MEQIVLRQHHRRFDCGNPRITPLASRNAHKHPSPPIATDESANPPNGEDKSVGYSTTELNFL